MSLWAGSMLWGPPAQLGMLQVWEGRWRVIPYDVLPDWLKDNDYLLHGHRPPMPSFRACFKSIFRIHTETGNIWTHLLGDWGGLGALGLKVGLSPTHKGGQDLLGAGVLSVPGASRWRVTLPLPGPVRAGSWSRGARGLPELPGGRDQDISSQRGPRAGLSDRLWLCFSCGTEKRVLGQDRKASEHVPLKPGDGRWLFTLRLTVPLPPGPCFSLRFVEFVHLPSA